MRGERPSERGTQAGDHLGVVRGAEGYWLPGQRHEHAHHFMVEDFHPRLLGVTLWPRAPGIPQGIARARQSVAGQPPADAAAHAPTPSWVLATVGARARPCGAPEGHAAQHAQDGTDVHAAGRGHATRLALAALLRQHPGVLEAPERALGLDVLHAYLTALLAQNHPLAHRRHDSGLTTLQAARRALARIEADVPPGLPNTLDAVAIAADGVEALTIGQVCALIWRAIEALRPQGYNAGDEHALHAERSEALVTALAECLDADGEPFCAAGMAQRLVLTLQGVVPEVQIELFEPAVARR